MPAPIRSLSNDYRECKLIKLDPNDPHSPVAVSQEGYSPSDPTCQMSLYYLQRDGKWIDEFSRSSVAAKEPVEIIFDTSADALQVLSKLVGKPAIRSLPVTEAEIREYIAKAKDVSTSIRELLARYRAAKASK
ncbi:MAG TPA: hypothetical protein VGH90_00135 [Chthoniobacteraceae bacterium]|jgi:hypothetical protein